MAAQGDQRAFAAIFHRHHQALYRYCQAILANGEDAADALQNTMVAALRSLPGERRQVALKPWLFRIAHNESISLLRRRREKPGTMDDDQVALADAHAELAVKEQLRELVSDLRELPERQRGALVMRELNGLGYPEIAMTFGISPAAAKQAVFEGRIALHDLAEGREMPCEAVRLAVSDGDGRALRGRKLRAHLRSCEACRSFRDSIRTRRSNLAAIAPPLPLSTSGGLLRDIFGGGNGGGGTGVAATVGVAKTAGASLGVKVAIGVVTLGAGAATGSAAGLGPLSSSGDRSTAAEQRPTPTGAGGRLGTAGGGDRERRTTPAARPPSRRRATSAAPQSDPSAPAGDVQISPQPASRIPADPRVADRRGGSQRDTATSRPQPGRRESFPEAPRTTAPPPPADTVPTAPAPTPTLPTAPSPDEKLNIAPGGAPATEGVWP